MSVSINGTNGLVFNDASTQNTAPKVGMVNRIINGSMTIDQRNAGASLTIPGAAVTYTLDRWFAYNAVTSKFSVQQNAGSITPPAGFSNYLGVTSLSAYTVGATEQYDIGTRIEGFNISDLAWGTANAKAVTISFWAYSSLTGTFGGSVSNNATNRCYVFSYSIPSANTWTYITITIPGDTTGTWVTNNGIGIRLSWGLGDGSSLSGTAGSWGTTYLTNVTGGVSIVGTNGATFYITGVQLEKGSTATSFDYRPYGTELALCQRYYEKSYNIETAVGTNIDATGEGAVVASGSSNQGGNIQIFIPFKVTKRANPTMAAFTSAGTSGQWTYATSATSGTNGTANFGATGQHGTRFYTNVGQNWASCNVGGCWTASAEL